MRDTYLTEGRTTNNPVMTIKKESKIYVAGHRGLAGSAIVRRLKADGFNDILTKSHDEFDLTRQTEVEAFFEKEKPDCVILCDSPAFARRFLMTVHAAT